MDEDEYTLQYTIHEPENGATLETLFADDSRVFSLDCSFVRPKTRVDTSMLHAAIATLNSTDASEPPVVLAETFYNLPTPDIQGHLRSGPDVVLTNSNAAGQIVKITYSFRLHTPIRYKPVVHMQLPIGFKMIQTGASSACTGTGASPPVVTVDPKTFMASVAFAQDIVVSDLLCSIEFLGATSMVPSDPIPNGLFMITNTESCFVTDDTEPGSCNLPDPLSRRDTNIVFSRTLDVPGTRDVPTMGLRQAKPVVTFGTRGTESTMTLFIERMNFDFPDNWQPLQLTLKFRDTPVVFPGSGTCRIDGSDVLLTSSNDFKSTLGMTLPIIRVPKDAELSITCTYSSTKSYVDKGDDVVTLFVGVSNKADLLSVPASCNGRIDPDSAFPDTSPMSLSYTIRNPSDSLVPAALVNAVMVASVPRTMPMSPQMILIADIPSAGYYEDEPPTCDLTADVVNFYRVIDITYNAVSPSYTAPGYFRVSFVVQTSAESPPRARAVETRIQCTDILAPLRSYDVSSGGSAENKRHGRLTFIGSNNPLGAAQVRVYIPITTTINALNVAVDPSNDPPFTAQFSLTPAAYASATGEITFTIDNTPLAFAGSFAPGSALSITLPSGYVSPGVAQSSRAALGDTCTFVAEGSQFETKMLQQDMYLPKPAAGAVTYSVRLRFPVGLNPALVSPTNNTHYSFRCMFNFPDTAGSAETLVSVLSPTIPGNGRADLAHGSDDTPAGFVRATSPATARDRLNLETTPVETGDVLGLERGVDGAPAKTARTIELTSANVGAYTMMDLRLATINTELGIRGYNMVSKEHFSLVLPETMGLLPYTQCFASWDNTAHSQLDPSFTDHFRTDVPSAVFPSATNIFMGVPLDAMSVVPKGFFHLRCAMRNPFVATAAETRALTALFDMRSDPVAETHSVRFPRMNIATFRENDGDNTLKYEGFQDFGKFGGRLRFHLAPRTHTGRSYEARLQVPSGTLQFVAGETEFKAAWITCSVDGADPLPVARVAYSADADPTKAPNVIVVTFPARAVHWPEDSIEIVCKPAVTSNAPESKVILLPLSHRLGESAEDRKGQLPYTSASVCAPAPNSEVLSTIEADPATKKGVATLPVTLSPEPGALRTITPADYNSTNWVGFEIAALGSIIPPGGQFQFYLPRVKGAVFAPPRGKLSKDIECKITVSGTVATTVSRVSLQHVYTTSSNDTPADELPAETADVVYDGEDIGYPYSILSVTTSEELPSSTTDYKTFSLECYLLHPAALIERMPTRAVLHATVAPKHVFIDASDVDFAGVFYMDPPEVLPIASATVVSSTSAQFAKSELTVTVLGVPTDMYMYDFIEVEFPETHLFEMLPSKKGSIIEPTPAAANTFVHDGEDTTDPSVSDISTLSQYQYYQDTPASPYSDSVGPVVHAPVSASLMRRRLAGPPSADSASYNGHHLYSPYTALSASLFDEGSVPDAMTTPCTVNGYPSLATVPPSWSTLSNISVDPCFTASIDPTAPVDPVPGRCGARSFAVALPFDLLKRATRAGTSAVTIKCSNVRTPVASPLRSGQDEDGERRSGRAIVRLVRPPYTSRSNYSIPLLIAEKKQVEIAPVIVPEWGAEIRTVTPANVTVRSDHGIITVAVSPVPMNIVKGAEITMVLPPMWTLQPADRDSSQATELCRASVDTPITTQANITGVAELVNNTRTITFWPDYDIPATDKVLRIFCDGVRVPSIPQPVMSTTVLRVQDTVTQFGNAAATLADLDDAVLGNKWLLTTLSKRGETPEIITGLAPREFVSHTLSIELRQPLNTTMLEKYVNETMKVLGREATVRNLLINAAIRKNVLVKVPIIIDDPRNTEEDVYVDVEMVFEGASNTNNFDVLRLVGEFKEEVAKLIAALTNTFIIRNPDPVITDIPGTCYNAVIDPGESSADCGRVCVACAIDSVCEVDEDCLTSTCVEKVVPGVGKQKRCEERPLVPIRPEPAKPNSATAVGASGLWALLAIVATAAVAFAL